MIIGWYSRMLEPESVYVSHKGHGATEDYWIVVKALTHPSIGLYGVEMRKIDILTWELTVTTKEFSKYDFLDGSGFGGGPYLIPDFFLKVQHGAIYRSMP
jgi:hypothetical protein